MSPVSLIAGTVLQSVLGTGTHHPAKASPPQDHNHPSPFAKVMSSVQPSNPQATGGHR